MTPANPRLLSILSDRPADQDQLDFAPYAETLAGIIADPGTHTPLIIGVFGGWGQGKTSLMRMVQRRGEIKRVLARQSFVAGIGNAYADEICWRAGIYPFRRRSRLSDDEVERLYTAMRDALVEALETLRARVGDAIDKEVRDFLSVHGKAGQPCPRCGSAISEVKRERRATHFCRACQPGLLIGR
jgi:ribosomal protein S13